MRRRALRLRFDSAHAGLTFDLDGVEPEPRSPPGQWRQVKLAFDGDQGGTTREHGAAIRQAGADQNRAWQTNCSRLLDGVPVGTSKLRVLDLGVGPGVSVLAMGRRYPNLQFIGIDIVQSMLVLAAANRDDEGWAPNRLFLSRADVFRLPLLDQSVDVVTGHSLLYLLEEE